MPRSALPEWRKRREPIVDGYVIASVTQAGGQGQHNSDGHYAELVITGLDSREEAAEYVRALNRSALWLTRNAGAEVGMSAKIEKTATGYRVRFKAVDKVLARKHILEKYGPDPSQWPYNPRARGA
jgi:hypothetical protein